MPLIAAIGTYLPRWGCDVRRIVGDDEDAVTRAVEGGRAEAVNQVDRARIALAHNIGGPTAVSAITILEGPETDGD
jgi:hypothetical protein